MGTFFEDLGKRLGETAETMTNKAGEAMEIQKLKNQIRTLERSNENDLAALGRMVYDQFKEGGHMSEEASGLCEAIQSREESIDACPSCGKMVGRDMAYCPYCGEKAPEKPKAESVSMEEKLKNAREKAGEYADKAADVINEMAGKAGEYASEAIDKASEYAEKAMEKAGEYADKVAEKMEDAAENVVDVMEEPVETAATEAGEAVKDEAAEAVEEATGDGEDKAE